ncbi:uncharacterized protein [Rutidosis leptorrhynchoides]|uniref:uncharacterized protein n=1 Tax=Rutidosis leptorrhynchoides TaxID=125765 RepID=UPI003A99B86F
MTIEERTGDINADIDGHDTEMVYPDDHEVNSQKELDLETEIDWELNADREFTQPEHDQPKEDQEDQEEELVPTEQERQNDVDSGSARSGKECPLHKRWHKVHKSTKKDLLAIIKTKVDIRGDDDKWILQFIGKKVKSWRNRLKKLHYDPSKSRHEQLKSRPKIQLGREPSRVDIFERSFSKADITNNFEAVKQLEQMKELSKELPKGSLDEPGPDDIYAKVRGTAKHGQAEMYGLGVRVSDVWGEVRSRAAICQENVKLKAELQEYKEREKQKNVMTDYSVVNPHASTNNGIITNTPLQVGKEVHLKSINNPTLIVAKGRLRSLDPLTVVGGVEIGPGWVKYMFKLQ